MMLKYGYDGIMWGGSGVLCSLVLLVLLVDLVLVGVWLWQHIDKK